jgi:hypothetical protein
MRTAPDSGERDGDASETRRRQGTRLLAAQAKAARRRAAISLFWSKVNKSAGPRRCWPWEGSSNPEKYGSHQAHRRAWRFARGPIPAGLYVLHKCDNRPCCNPRHLFLGTAKDNVDDADRKGRMRRGRTPGRRNLTAGEREQITVLLAAGASRADVARQFGVTERTIYYRTKAPHNPHHAADRQQASEQ